MMYLPDTELAGYPDKNKFLLNVKKTVEFIAFHFSYFLSLYSPFLSLNFLNFLE